MSTYNITEFSKVAGVSVKTLQRWDREGKLVPTRTPTGRRVYTDEHVAQAIGVRGRHLIRKNVVYARVSSQAQKPDLEQQIKALEQFCVAQGLSVDEWISEVGGGLSFQRKKFRSLIRQIESGEVSTLVVAHQDRLARFGFDLIEYLCELHGTRLLVVNSESLSPEREMVEDMLAIVHCFSSRLYGLRSYRKVLREALKHDASTQDQTESNA
jgi:predicted site-specific integrase-resolvase